MSALVAVSIGVWVWSGTSETAGAGPAPVDPWLEDVDVDGLSKHQEQILATSDDQPDTDLDGHDDLVELARGSDPTDANSVPPPQLVSVGMTSRSDAGVVTVVSAIYATYAQFPFFGYEMGASFGGVEFTIPTSTLLATSSLVLYPSLDSTGWIIVLETAIPQSLISTYGYLGLYGLISEAGEVDPATASVLNLFEMDGQVVAFQPAPDGMQAGGGSIYQPLGRGEELPATWEAGQVCWQLTQVVGTDGNSVILDVEDADCLALDSHCNATACVGGIGVSVTVLDAGALVGGG